MTNPPPTPQPGATRFGTDGTLEVFDGVDWVPYQPPQDDGYGTVFRDPDPLPESRR